MKEVVINLVVVLLFSYLTINRIRCAPQYKNDINDSGYHFEYSTNDSERSETGKFKENQPEKPIIVITGSYKHQAPDFFQVTNVFKADEKGFRPEVTIDNDYNFFFNRTWLDDY